VIVNKRISKSTISQDDCTPLITDRSLLISRISNRITRGEFAALCLAVGFLCGFAYLQWQGYIYPNDYTVFIKAVQGDVFDYYYAYWMLPVFGLFKYLPMPMGYLIWGLLNLAGLWLAVRLFGGPSVFVLISYQLMYVLYYGQITGIILGGLALIWLGIVFRKWNLAGLGLAIAVTKFQMGIVMGGLLLWFSPLTWQEKIRVLLIPSIVTTISLVVYPGWPWQLIQIIQKYPPNDWGNISLWLWIGPYALLLIIPALLLPFAKHERFMVLIATATIALPYFQQTDLLMFFCLPIGWIALLGNIGYFYPFIGWDILRILSIPPLVWIVLQVRNVFIRIRNDDIHLQPKT
jgi:hypothetical protein